MRILESRDSQELFEILDEYFSDPNQSPSTSGVRILMRQKGFSLTADYSPRSSNDYQIAYNKSKNILHLGSFQKYKPFCEISMDSLDSFSIDGCDYYLNFDDGSSVEFTIDY